MSIPSATAGSFEVEDDEDGPAPERVTDRLEAVGQRVADLVVARPLTAIGIALAIGFVIGRSTR